MTKKEFNLMTDLVVNKVIERLKGIHNLSEPEYVDTKEAARILKISAAYLRQVKDRYPHIKEGDKQQGRILFLRDALLNEWKSKSAQI